MPEEKGAKRGAWSVYERQYISDHMGKKTVEEIAVHLNRDINTLRRYMGRQHSVMTLKNKEISQEDEIGEIREELRNRLAWKKLKDEFEPDELLYFEEEYIALMRQFKEDVFATEEQQIRKAITIDIFMRRNAAARKKLLKDIVRVESWLEKATREYKADKAGLDQPSRQAREEFLLNLETQLSSLRAAEQSKTKEYSDLDNRHQKLMEALKATREQRIAKIESSGKTFLGIIRDLMDEDRVRAEGRQLDMMRRASTKTLDNLAKPHKYDDGNEDQPILSSETVEMLDAQVQSEEEDDEDE